MKRKGGKTDQKWGKNKNEYEDNYQLSTEQKKTQTQNDTCILQP